jgi:hypothetical protein
MTELVEHVMSKCKALSKNTTSIRIKKKRNRRKKMIRRKKTTL